MSTVSQDNALVNVITTAIQIPGVKVNRELFLREQFQKESKETIEHIIEVGPVKAKIGRKKIKKLADRILKDRTAKSSAASFAAGIPGGLAMAATIPADMMQFYGISLRVAQEIAYLYGESDLWSEGSVDSDKVMNQLILYCGVMFGVNGAAHTIRIISSQMAKQALKKLPQQALTKTFYYPIIKSIAKALGLKMTKDVFAKGVSKAIPIIGGVISGGITLATMFPMGNRLIDALDEAHFDYTEEEFKEDWEVIQDVVEKEEDDIIEGEFVEKQVENKTTENTEDKTTEVLNKINQAKSMMDSGIITEEEFNQIKARLISQL